MRELKPEILMEFDDDRCGEKCVLKNHFTAGYVWVPSLIPPEFIAGVDPIDEFNPKIEILSRYSKKEVNKNFYGKIKF